MNNEQHITTYGVIGYPLSHTLSPVMHNTAFQALDVEAVYQAMEIHPDDLEEFFQSLKKDESPIFGLNVTVPYKESVLKYMDSLNPLAEKLQAVNTIVIEKGRKLVGYNTDAPGFMAHLHELNVELKDKKIVILGAGGSCRAILASFCMMPKEERPEQIVIYNRTASRLEELLESLRKNFDLSIVETVFDVEEINLETSDILINTTSIGLKEEDPLLVDPDVLHSGLFVYDLIYNPLETELLRVARENGAKTANGSGMLFYQGVLAFQKWAEMELPPEIKQEMRRALDMAITKKN